MKKFWKYIAIATFAVVMAPLTACDDDSELGPKDKANYEANFVYLDQPTSTYAQVEYKANGDFMSGLTDPYKLVPIRLTKPAPSKLQVEVVIDETLVDEYNEAHGTDYKFLEGASIDNSTIGIAAGQYMSYDTIQVSFGDHSGFIDQEKDLILPIVVKGGEGLTQSKSGRIFLTFTSTYRPNYLTVPTVNKMFKVVTMNPGWEETIKTIELNNVFKLTYEPYEDVTLNIEIDESKVAEYNAANGTDYQFKSDASLVSNTLTVGTDSNWATFGINTGDPTGIANEITYVIPVTIKSVNGAAVEFGEGSQTVYVVVKGVGRELTASTTLTGTTQLPTPVACTVNGNTINSYGYEWVKVLDSSKGDWGYIQPNEVMEIDFGQVVNLSSFYIYHYGSSYGSTGIKLETSADGSKWIDWGEVSYSKSSYCNISLSAPENVQYMRLVFTGGGSSWGGIDIEWIKFYQN